MTEPDDEVAKLYEEHPYPAHGVVSTVIARLASPTLGVLDVAGAVRVLDAGCGTGEQTLGLARAHPEVEVVGIDLNQPSIAFARSLGARHGIDARFEQADLLGSLQFLGQFDLVISIGVLHHLDAPGRALARIREVVAPGGRLLLMLYGTFGRAPMFDARDAFALAQRDAGREERLAVARDVRSGVNGGPAHLATEAARRMRFGPDLSPIEMVRRVIGGRSAAYQADAFTHPQERSYTWAEAAELLASEGWRLDGWPARSGLPDHAEQLFRPPTAQHVDALPVARRAAIYERLVRPSNLYLLATADDGGE